MAVDYKKLTDTELAVLIRKSNDNSATNELVKRYKLQTKKMVCSLLMLNYGSGISYDELEAVGLQSIFTVVTAIKSNSTSFLSYWKVVARREMINYIDQNSYHVGAKLFSGVSLNDSSPLEDGLSNSEIYGKKDDEKEKIFKKEILSILETNKKFTKTEKKIITLFLENYTFKEISKMTGRCLSDVYINFNKSAKKLKSILAKRYFN